MAASRGSGRAFLDVVLLFRHATQSDTPSHSLYLQMKKIKETKKKVLAFVSSSDPDTFKA